MAKRTHTVTVKLTPAEYQALCKTAGETNAEKIRGLLHGNTIADTLAHKLARRIDETDEKLAAAVDRLENNQRKINERIARHDQAMRGRKN